MTRPLWHAVLTLATLAPALRAQDLPLAQVGETIRIVASSDHALARCRNPDVWSCGEWQRATGTLRFVASDTLGLDDQRFALDDIAQVERLAGRRGAAGEGAVIGLLVGAVAGGLVGAATYTPCTGFCIIDFDEGTTIAMGALAGVLLGTPVGAMIGASVRVDRWEKVRLAPSGPGRHGLSLAPAYGRNGVGFRARLTL